MWTSMCFVVVPSLFYFGPQVWPHIDVCVCSCSAVTQHGLESGGLKPQVKMTNIFTTRTLNIGPCERCWCRSLDVERNWRNWRNWTAPSAAGGSLSSKLELIVWIHFWCESEIPKSFMGGWGELSWGGGCGSGWTVNICYLEGWWLNHSFHATCWSVISKMLFFFFKRQTLYQSFVFIAVSVARM